MCCISVLSRGKQCEIANTKCKEKSLSSKKRCKKASPTLKLSHWCQSKQLLTDQSLSFLALFKLPDMSLIDFHIKTPNMWLHISVHLLEFVFYVFWLCLHEGHAWAVSGDQAMWEGLIIPCNVCVIHYHITNLWPLKEERSFGVCWIRILCTPLCIIRTTSE